MVRRTDRPLRNVRVSFETTRFGEQHLIDAYDRLVPVVKRVRRQARGNKSGRPEIKVAIVKTRGGKA